VTQIDFYVLEGTSEEARLGTACRIVDKAVERDKRVYVNSASEGEARKLDELLWTFSQGSFIPHRVVRAAGEPAGEEPVLIGCGQPPADGAADIMVNLANEVPEFFSRYQRVAEVINGEPARREQGRERFRIYKEHGCEPNVHRI
jgi:DNA polymerase III subunit chi